MDYQPSSKIKVVSKLFSKLISFLLAAYVCYLLYDYLLKDIFKIEISFFKWIVIKTMFHLLLPNTVDSIKNDKQGA